MAKIKIIKAWGSLKVGETFELRDMESHYLVDNGYAKYHDCGGDCEECEDCKGKNKKKAPVKKATTKSTKTKKAPTDKK